MTSPTTHEPNFAAQLERATVVVYESEPFWKGLAVKYAADMVARLEAEGISPSVPTMKKLLTSNPAPAATDFAGGVVNPEIQRSLEAGLAASLERVASGTV